MTRTIPALGALALTLSLLAFALVQGAAPTVLRGTAACLDAPAAAPAPAPAPHPVEVTSCGEETVLASAESR